MKNKYRVKKTGNRIWVGFHQEIEVLEDLGIMTIDQIRELAKKYIGKNKVFKNEQEIEEDMKIIEETGGENWAPLDEDYSIDIEIMEEK